MFITTQYRCYEGRAVFSVRSLWTTYQGTGLVAEDQTDMLYRNVDDYRSARRNIPEVLTSGLQGGGSLKSLKTTSCVHWKMISVVIFNIH